MTRDATLSLAERTRVADVMTTDVVCVEPGMSIETAAALFLERGISGAPVVDDALRPIGVLTKTDLLREYHEGTETLEVDAAEAARVETAARRRPRGGKQEELQEGFHVDRGRSAAVRDVMTPVTFSLGESAPLSQAAALMAFEAVHRVPIVDTRGAVVGILSALDLVRWLAQEEGYVLRKPAAPRAERSAG